MTDAATLADAERALHDLLTGQQASVFVDQNGERIEYRAAHAGRLQAYVAELRASVAGRPAARVLRTISSKGL